MSNIKTAEGTELTVNIEYIRYKNVEKADGDNAIVPYLQEAEFVVNDIMMNPGFFRFIHTDGTIEDIPADAVKHMTMKKNQVVGVRGSLKVMT